mmetsp:Transcript_55781/g.172915  ORF Transcript_55781/g.172915 Transcript_55781/m.172915 type:complete len:189 (-) Transcript_55781:83-649(-)
MRPVNKMFTCPGFTPGVHHGTPPVALHCFSAYVCRCNPPRRPGANSARCDQNEDGKWGCCCSEGFQSNEDDDCLACPATSINVTIPKRCIAAMLVASGASVVGAPYLLAMAGFTSAGIAGGSLAALWQSTMVGGAGLAGGGVFATLQSMAMGGLGMSTGLTLAGSTGTAALAFCKKVNEMCAGCIGDL